MITRRVFAFGAPGLLLVDRKSEKHRQAFRKIVAIMRAKPRWMDDAKTYHRVQLLVEEAGFDLATENSLIRLGEGLLKQVLVTVLPDILRVTIESQRAEDFSDLDEAVQVIYK